MALIPEPSPIGVAGAGAWGTALAIAAARTGRAVRLWARDPAQAERIASSARNERYLPGIELPAGIEVTADLPSLRATDPLLLVVPAQAVRATCRALGSYAGPVLICAKGLERGSGLRLSEVVAAELPQARPAALSGPSFAAEVARGLPTAVTIAAGTQKAAAVLAATLASPAFRPYPSRDLIGVETGGALKNVIAIAAGVVMGAELGENARAALIARGLAEIGRLGQALGANPLTLTGLSGLGDLMLTATSLTSRNTRLGFDLGRGLALADLLAPGAALSEGAATAGAACRLAGAVGVELPISQAVRRVVAGEVGVREAIDALLSRPLATSE